MEELQDSLIDIVGEMVRLDGESTISTLCGIIIGVTEHLAESNGHSSKSTIELCGAPRKITIHAADK